MGKNGKKGESELGPSDIKQPIHSSKWPNRSYRPFEMKTPAQDSETVAKGFANQESFDKPLARRKGAYEAIVSAKVEKLTRPAAKAAPTAVYVNAGLNFFGQKKPGPRPEGPNPPRSKKLTGPS